MKNAVELPIRGGSSYVNGFMRKITEAFPQVKDKLVAEMIGDEDFVVKYNARGMSEAVQALLRTYTKGWNDYGSYQMEP